MSWFALLPLRAGSKSIPGKNLAPLAGRPLYAWSLGAALDAGVFDRVFVASDGADIRADVAARFGTRVTVLDRAAENATDTASSESVMLEFLARHACDVLALVQATSPLTRAADFRAARTRFLRDELDSLLTATRTRRFFWRDDGTALNYDPARRPRRQDFSGLLMENGAFYYTRASRLVQDGCRLGGRIGIHEMDPEHATELDEPEDWPVLERLLGARVEADLGARGVAALVVDVDGTLTDGGMYYGPAGEALKRFDTRDARGLAALRASGVRVCVVSGEDSPAVAARMARLGIDDYHPGIADKAALLPRLLARWGLPAAAVAVIGDDTNDLDLMRAAGWVACPADARPEVRAAADFCCRAGGGRGAVREVCDLLLAARQGGRATL